MNITIPLHVAIAYSRLAECDIMLDQTARNVYAITGQQITSNDIKAAVNILTSLGYSVQDAAQSVQAILIRFASNGDLQKLGFQTCLQNLREQIHAMHSLAQRISWLHEQFGESVTPASILAFEVDKIASYE